METYVEPCTGMRKDRRVRGLNPRRPTNQSSSRKGRSMVVFQMEELCEMCRYLMVRIEDARAGKTEWPDQTFCPDCQKMLLSKPRLPEGPLMDAVDQMRLN